MNTDITISVPSEIAANLGGDEVELSRKTLEALPIEGYRNGSLSLGQTAELLGYSVLRTEEFLYERNVLLNYSATEFEEDLEVIEKFDQ